MSHYGGATERHEVAYTLFAALPQSAERLVCRAGKVEHIVGLPDKLQKLESRIMNLEAHL